MGLFSQAKMDEINAIAEKSKEVLKPIKVSKSVTSSQHEIQEATKKVMEYFKDSPAILITSKEQLHEYVLNAIESGYCGIDTETTGLDRIHDTIVGASLYYPGGVECYIPCKHLAPVFEVPYEGQLSYKDLGEELQLFVSANTKMIFANADFDLAMIYKDLKVDLIPVCYYDVITAWRCIKEDELDNRLKALYMKYVKRGKGDPMSFSDFFNPKLFPYSQPEVAKLYAANDAKITYELFYWQLPYITKSHPKCQKRRLEKISDLIWNIEFPMVRVCALMHRVGVYFDKENNSALKLRYDKKYQDELSKLSVMVQEIIDNSDAVTISKSPFKSGAAFNEGSPKHVVYLLNNFLHCDVSSGDKYTLTELNLPVTNQILQVRALGKLLNSFVDKLPNEVASDGRVHATFKAIGADTGRMCIAKGTSILCSGGAKPIEMIVPGDKVYCYNNSGELERKPVKNLWLTGNDKECVKVTWKLIWAGKEVSRSLLCTPEHLILTSSGDWIPASELTLGTQLVHWDSEVVPEVTEVVADSCYDVYDIEVEDNHNFIAQGICVHNSSAEPNVQQIPSHALDIRHQFRATPAKEVISDCSIDRDIATLEIGSYDSVILADESNRDVIDLQIGDIIKVYDSSVLLKVKSIEHKLPITILSMTVEGSYDKLSIKHITPPYVMMSSDYSQQEPRLTAFVSSDPKMCDAFKHGRDIYSTIASLAFNKTYEECSEFFFDENGNKTDQVNREGKERRTQAKSIVLGITYGRSTKTIGDQLFGKNKEMTDEDKTKEAQKIYDAVLNAFPNLRACMLKVQNDAKRQGYVETILGRRRHIPDMQLPPYEFKAAKGYVNPDIDPLDPSTLQNKNEIPERIVRKLTEEFNNYKYYGQVVKATKRLADEHIKVINNSRKITDATRKCLNSVIQGSAADMTKIAMLKIFNNKEWNELGARMLLPVHDELIAEVPIRNAERAGELLAGLMSEAGNFLPFTISCDVETTYKWYGLEYPCPYNRPAELSEDHSNLSEDEIKWIQYHLFECEYTLPVYKDKDGKKPMGDAALGVNGIWSQELADSLYDYMNKYKISLLEFMDNIHHRVNGDVIK